jgi:hypothetical protein
MPIASNISTAFFLIATLLQHLRDSTCAIVESFYKKLGGATAQPRHNNCQNLCSCGYQGSNQKPCSCAVAVVTRYQLVHAYRRQRYSNKMISEYPKIEYWNIVCNADMWIGEVQQFCRLQI